jgi:hypothetical protein
LNYSIRKYKTVIVYPLFPENANGESDEQPEDKDSSALKTELANLFGF